MIFGPEIIEVPAGYYYSYKMSNRWIQEKAIFCVVSTLYYYAKPIHFFAHHGKLFKLNIAKATYFLGVLV